MSSQGLAAASFRKRARRSLSQDVSFVPRATERATFATSTRSPRSPAGAHRRRIQCPFAGCSVQWNRVQQNLAGNMDSHFSADHINQRLPASWLPPNGVDPASLHVCQRCRLNYGCLHASCPSCSVDAAATGSRPRVVVPVSENSGSDCRVQHNYLQRLVQSSLSSASVSRSAPSVDENVVNNARAMDEEVFVLNIPATPPPDMPERNVSPVYEEWQPNPQTVPESPVLSAAGSPRARVVSQSPSVGQPQSPSVGQRSSQCESPSPPSPIAAPRSPPRPQQARQHQRPGPVPVPAPAPAPVEPRLTPLQWLPKRSQRSFLRIPRESTNLFNRLFAKRFSAIVEAAREEDFERVATEALAITKLVGPAIRRPRGGKGKGGSLRYARQLQAIEEAGIRLFKPRSAASEIQDPNEEAASEAFGVARTQAEKRAAYATELVREGFASKAAAHLVNLPMPEMNADTMDLWP